MKNSAKFDVDAVLKERGREYGPFIDQAMLTQSIKLAMKDGKNWNSLLPDMKESLEMVAHKIARILNGNPDNLDSWVDIEGYVHLVVKRLNQIR